MNSFAKGVAATVVAGLVMLVLASYLELPLSPKAKVSWGTYAEYRLPDERENSFRDRYGFSLRLENFGAKASEPIEILLRSSPSFVSSDPPLLIDSEKTPRGHMLRIDQLGAGDHLILGIDGVSWIEVEYVREAGQILEKSYIARPEFTRQFGVTLPLFAAWLLFLYVLWSANTLWSKHLSSREIKTEKQVEQKGDKQITEESVDPVSTGKETDQKE